MLACLARCIPVQQRAATHRNGVEIADAPWCVPRCSAVCCVPRCGAVRARGAMRRGVGSVTQRLRSMKHIVGKCVAAAVAWQVRAGVNVRLHGPVNSLSMCMWAPPKGGPFSVSGLSSCAVRIQKTKKCVAYHSPPGPFVCLGCCCCLTCRRMGAPGTASRVHGAELSTRCMRSDAQVNARSVQTCCICT